MAAKSPLTASEMRSTGLLWALWFEGGRARLLHPQEMDAALAREDGWVWAHCALSDHRARLFIERFEAAPEEARASMLAHEPRVQVKVAGEWAYGALPDLEREFDGAGGGPGRLMFAMGRRAFLTARRHALQVVDEVRRAIERGEETPRPADLFEALIERYIDVSHARLGELTHQLDQIEDRVLSGRADLERIGLGPIRRELSLQHREFLSLRSALQRAMATRGGVERCGLEAVLPTLAQHVEDFDRDAAGLQALARLLHEEVEAQLANAANRSLRVLTVLTALLMPATLVVGAFGMNLQGIPYADRPWGFALICALCAGVVAAGFVLLRRMMR